MPNRIRHSSYLPIAVALALAVPSGDAWALFGDRLELFAQERITYDDNVFRVADDADVRAVTRSDQKGDWYSTTSLGFNVRQPWSRQVFEGGWAANITRYKTFDDMDLTGHEGRALWLWQLGNDLSGQLGYTDIKAQAAFAGLGARIFDPVTTRTVHGTAVYNITPSWRLSAGAAGAEQRHQEQTRKGNDVDVRTVNGAFAYVTPANNQYGVEARRTDADYPNRDFIPGVSLVDIRYRETAAGVFTEYQVSGESHLSVHIGRLKREYDNLPERDFSATVGRIGHLWTYSGRLTLETTLRREVVPVEDLAASAALVRGITFHPAYRLTEKATLLGNVDYARRKYIVDPGLVIPEGAVVTRPAGSVDTLWTAGVGVTYRYSRTLSFLADYHHEERSADYTFGDYKANVVFVQARLGI
jgi:hypothetical protein